jgi:NADH-quinone oxidoreductase subunit E
MAWIVKNSAGTQIERRDEPYLTQEIKEHFEANIVTRYPSRRAASIPLLHALQDKYNWLPPQALEEAAEFLGIQASELMDTASFYEMFWLKPKGKYLIMVCQSISCELLGHEKLIEALEKKLGITVGQTTPDGKFTLIHGECLGSCGTAPCALLNDRLHENLTVENLSAIIDSCE